jgi:hypothetical protein
MPTPHPDRTGKPASPAQQRYLRALAQQTGTTFSPPRDSADASRQIDAMKRRGLSDRRDVARERREVSSDLASRAGDAARVRAGEVDGYGSHARWVHGHTSPQDQR